MNLVTAKAALYIGYHGDTTDIQQQALAYCQTHDYVLTSIYQDTGTTQPVLNTVKEAMEARDFHLLLIPSAEHIYGKQLGQMLTFLIEAQEAHVDVVCLEPKPTSLYTQGLAIVPQSIEHMTTVEDIVRCLRFR